MTHDEFDAFLDDITASFLTRNFDQWMGRLRLPMTFVTKDGPTILTTLTDARHYFDLCLSAIHNLHMDMILRRPVTTDLSDLQTTLVTFETETLSKGVRLIAPYTTHALVHHSSETGWRMSSAMNALRFHQWTDAPQNQNSDLKPNPYPTGETT